MLEFKLPEVGENIETGSVVDIFVSVGDAVKKDQDLLELETEKASLGVPSPCDGIIKEILVKVGEDVKIGSIIMKIEEQGSTSKQGESTQQAGKKDTITAAVDKESKTTPQTVVLSQVKATIMTAPSKIKPNEAIPAQFDVPAAPTVRRLARELGIIISQVPPTGPGGRISKDDVKAFAKYLITSGPAISSQPQERPLPDFSKWGKIDRQGMNNIRKKIAEHLSFCWQTIPHVTQFDKADITDVEILRKAKSTPKRKLTITPFLLKVMAEALKEFPQFNASIDMTTKEIIYKKYFHLGVAVDTDRGLLVPIVRDVDQKGIFSLTDELNEIAERARIKKTSLEELKGGCMTLTNLGGIGGTFFTPIVNWPEVAILGVSRGSWEPSYQDKKFIPRFKLPLALSYDHRIIDGADGARFLRFVCEKIEQTKWEKLLT